MNNSKIRHVSILYNSHKTNASNAALEVKEWLNLKGIDVALYSDYSPNLNYKDNQNFDPNTNFCIVLGGDGTFLYAARKLIQYNTPLLCVNTGHIGFLSAISLSNLYKGLELILEDKYFIQKRLMLYSYVIDKNNNKIILNSYALNDVVIFKNSYRLIYLDVYIDGNFVATYVADGLIISTPTGSTAYCLSGGGPILTPDVPAFIIIPICPYTLSLRPLVISDNCTIKIEPAMSNENKTGTITIDGQENFTINEEHTIYIKKAPYYTNFIKFYEGESFFDTLRTKLQWGYNKIKKI